LRKTILRKPFQEKQLPQPNSVFAIGKPFAKPLHLSSPGRGHTKDQAEMTSPVMMNASDQIEQDLRRQCGGAA
jgi:hypothetical protein